MHLEIGNCYLEIKMLDYHATLPTPRLIGRMIVTTDHVRVLVNFLPCQKAMCLRHASSNNIFNSSRYLKCLAKLCSLELCKIEGTYSSQPPRPTISALHDH